LALEFNRRFWFLKQSDSLRFIYLAGVFAFASMYTGEGEEAVEDMPNIGKQIIHEHEELMKISYFTLCLAAFSLASLYNCQTINMKSLSYITLILAMGAVVLGSFCRNYGGEYCHTEIRENALQKSNYTKRGRSPTQNKRGKREYFNKRININ
jgi:hypothetical protein